MFCEKPDAINAEQAMKMKETSEKVGKVLMIMRNNRFTDASKFVKDYIDAGKMGDVYGGRCGWQRRRGIPGKGGWFTTKELSGGGPLIDLGVHIIDLSIWFMGNPKPVAVSGSTYCKFAEDTAESDSEHSQFGDRVKGGTFDVEDLAMGFIRFDNGAVLQIEFSWASNVKEEVRFVELRGSKSGLTLRHGTQLEFYTEEEGRIVNIVPAGHFEDAGHRAMFKNFVDVVTRRC